jgi:hypothetical protein
MYECVCLLHSHTIHTHFHTPSDQTYEKGTPCYAKLVENFGPQIVSEEVTPLTPLTPLILLILLTPLTTPTTLKPLSLGHQPSCAGRHRVLRQRQNEPIESDCVAGDTAADRQRAGGSANAGGAGDLECHSVYVFIEL